MPPLIAGIRSAPWRHDPPYHQRMGPSISGRRRPVCTPGRRLSLRPNIRSVHYKSRRLVQQLRGVLCRVAGVEQHHGEACGRFCGRRHEAAPGGVGVAGLQADRARVARPDQRVVAVEEQAAALDREVEVHLAAARDPRGCAARHGEPGQHGEVAAHERLPSSRPCEEAKCVHPSPHLARLRVHQSHEAALAPRQVHGQGDRSVVAGHDQHPVEERLEPHPPATRETPTPEPE